MTLPWLGEEDAVLWHGDVRALLAEVPDESVQCVVTSPPYWGLRDYGTSAWEGGDPTCDHLAPPKRTAAGFNERWHGKAYDSDKQGATRNEPYRAVCGKCDARRVDQQIGLERTPGEYVARMVEVFREVRRVLRGDGVCWLNLGDCYATGGGAQGAKWRGGHEGKHGRVGPMTQPNRMPLPGLKAKDLVGVPWAVAFALRDDGWYLRADTIWSKPNSMPESATDRPTKVHEYVFLLTKSERYYWDAENAREGAVGGTQSTRAASFKRANSKRAVAHPGQRNGTHRPDRADVAYNSSTRNLRSVWEITTRPYAGAHFATFPPEIPRRCIRASTPEYGCCSVCATPYRRVVEKGEPLAEQRALCGADSTGGYSGVAQKDYAASKAQDPSAVKARILAGMVERKTVAWVSQCDCRGSVPVPSLVLDPFAGSGTTLAVAIEEGRRALGFELNPTYIGLALERIDASRETRKGAA